MLQLIYRLRSLEFFLCLVYALLFIFCQLATDYYDCDTCNIDIDIIAIYFELNRLDILGLCLHGGRTHKGDWKSCKSPYV